MHTIPQDDVDDDRPIGRVLSRREVLLILGMAGGALAAACVPATLPPAATATPALSAEQATAVAMQADPAVAAAAATESAAAAAANAATTPDCIVRPEMTEGPYFVDTQLNRRDVRVEPSDGSIKEGMPLVLAFVVSSIANNACSLLSGAMVDIWHCDVDGVYSGVTDSRFDTTGQSWLRGYQVTGADGRAEFLTIYPGWYSGRAVHIHFKIRTPAGDGRTWDFTSQLFFPEEVNAQVFSQEPYAAKGLADVPNEADGIFRNGGDQLVLSPVATGDGYTAQFHIALDLANG